MHGIKEIRHNPSVLSVSSVVLSKCNYLLSGNFRETFGTIFRYILILWVSVWPDISEDLIQEVLVDAHVVSQFRVERKRHYILLL